MSNDRHRQSPTRMRGLYPCGLARWHSPPGLIPATVMLPSTFLRALRSRPVTALHRYYGRSDSCPPNSWTWDIPYACSTCGQVSLIHAPGLSAIPSPTTGAPPGRLRTSSRSRPDNSPISRGDRVSLIICGLTDHVSRIEFALLRAGRSPPAALHLALPRRSCRLVTV
jgi:hypothetical protein